MNALKVAASCFFLSFSAQGTTAEPTKLENKTEWYACREASNCAIVTGTCGDHAANLLYVRQVRDYLNSTKYKFVFCHREWAKVELQELSRRLRCRDKQCELTP